MYLESLSLDAITFKNFEYINPCKINGSNNWKKWRLLSDSIKSEGELAHRIQIKGNIAKRIERQAQWSFSMILHIVFTRICMKKIVCFLCLSFFVYCIFFLNTLKLFSDIFLKVLHYFESTRKMSNMGKIYDQVSFNNCQP